MKGLMDGFFIGDSGILARLFRPHGPARCPLVVIFHGFPGIELNYDIAYALRDAGCAALVPHYEGSWGSKGDFRVDRLADTVATVLKHARSEPFAKRYGIDPGQDRGCGTQYGWHACGAGPGDRPRGARRRRHRPRPPESGRPAAPRKGV